MDSAPVFHPSRSKYFVLTLDYFFPIAIIVSVCALAWLAVYSPFFRVSSVTCQIDYKPCTDPIVLAELDKIKGENIFRFNPTTLETRLTSGDFTIREAQITRELPSAVIVALQSVYPVVALKIAGESSWVVLDNNFRVIGTHTTDPNVPTVIVSSPLTLTVGKAPTDPTLIQTLNLAKNLASELVTIKSLTLQDSNTILVLLPNNLQAIFTTEKDSLPQIKVLQAVLKGATLTKDVHTIDVRFARPVLR
jgi:cell division septal protein FtsQ